MNRYSVITKKNPREIVLLRSRPCLWGKCLFCDYIMDNTTKRDELTLFNKEILKNVTGKYKTLEVINSASVFELSDETLDDIYNLCKEKGITTVYFEAYYNYRFRLQEIRDRFKGIKVNFKCGIESFNDDFRNGYLRKNVNFKSPSEVREFFDNICLLFGIKGQTYDMIDKDVEIALKYFNRICINIFVENTTPVKRDEDIVNYFRENYSYLEDDDRVEILWNNTDFGVGD